MNEKIREYLNQSFANAPKTRQAAELKDELYANMVEKYNDLRSKDYSEQDAHNAVIESIGDIGVLIEKLKYETGMDFERIQQERRKSAAIVATCVFLYFIAVIAAFTLDYYGVPDVFVAVALIGISAVSTCVLIYHNMSRPRYEKRDDSMVEEFKSWQSRNIRRKEIMKSIYGILWLLTVALYFILSFIFHIWAYSWVIFILAAAATQIIKLIFDEK